MELSGMDLDASIPIVTLYLGEHGLCSLTHSTGCIVTSFSPCLLVHIQSVNNVCIWKGLMPLHISSTDIAHVATKGILWISTYPVIFSPSLREYGNRVCHSITGWIVAF